ncbi:hypothetical protein [Enterococcus canis]|nr:hypothetical protein [Enterococcus canis]
MEQLENTYVEVDLLEAGKEEPTKQTMKNIKAHPSNEALISMGKIFGALAPQDVTFDSVVKIEETRITE